MRHRRIFIMICLMIGVVLAACPAPAGAANAFSVPAFRNEWQADESIAANFWGPLANAHEGQQEPYVEANRGMRLVQYFDKGRMELVDLSTPGTKSPPVTNGLLATELITGRVQVGDNAFQDKAPPIIPMAGDSTNPGPTYAQLKAHADQLLVPVSSRILSPTQGGTITVMLGVTGEMVPFSEGANYPAANISLYDDITQHNVPRAFASYRQRVGLGNVGLAISEPFWSNPKVGGRNVLVLVQAFERRVLTYTPVNDPAYQIEMGNIGQHYYRWRYGM